MELQRSPISCGAQLMFDLPYRPDTVARRLRGPNYRHWYQRRAEVAPEGPGIFQGETILFSDADSYGNGKRIEKWIKDNGLGEIVKLSTINPNTRNRITTYLWVYNGNMPKEKKPRAKTATKKTTTTKRVEVRL